MVRKVGVLFFAIVAALYLVRVGWAVLCCLCVVMYGGERTRENAAPLVSNKRGLFWLLGFARSRRPAYENVLRVVGNS